MSQPVVPCTVHLPIFEGPLDLLLHLIKKNEVQVTDIPIASITDQYLATLEAHPELNLDGAGEYLVMAATLMVIKSRLLLPTNETDEAEEDPRTELVQQLVEYQRFREVAVALGERPLLARDVFAPAGEAATPAPADEPAPAPVREASLGDLLAAFREVLQRRRPPTTHHVSREEYSLTGAVAQILDRFALETEVEFGSLFPADVTVGQVIVTFLALLEHGQVLVGDGGDGNVRDLHLVALDEMQEQVERPLEDRQPNRAGRAHPIPIASRTSAMVSAATLRARAFPASSAARASSGRRRARRSLTGASSARTCLIMIFLHSRQPMPAVRQPSST